MDLPRSPLTIAARRAAGATLAVAALLGARAAPAAPQLQLPGEFHGEETVARDGEAWFALVVEGTAARLVATTLRVDAVNDAVLDAEGEKTGRSVGAPPPADAALAFLRGVPALRAGALATAQAQPLALSPGARWPLALPGGATAMLAMVCPAAAAEAAEGECLLQLQSAADVQTLARFAALGDGAAWQIGSDATPQLLYAGDLDRDGRLDLLIDVTDHYNVGAPTLFLSGAAHQGEQVREVASQRNTGC